MQDPATSSSPSAGRAAALAAIAAAVIAAAGAIWLGARVSTLAGRIDVLSAELTRVRQTTQLIRLEGRSAGRGIGAILEQIEFWAPQLATATTPHPAAMKIEDALNECLDAVDALGAGAYAPVLSALQSPNAKGDETRKWLLRAAVRAAPADGRALLASVLRGTRLAPSPRLRFFAADELLRDDKEFAGSVLSQVLQIESAQGVTRQVPPGLAPEYERVIGTNTFPEFFNLIERFVQSGHADVENVLQMILGRAEHDRMTYQECIRALGGLRSRAALPRIKELYTNPPRAEVNPLFLNVCLQAIAEIAGPDACDWLRDELRRMDIPVVSTKLQELLKQYCGER